MESILNPLLLTTAILMTPNVHAGQDADAIKAIGKATYKQMHIDQQVKVLEKRYISKDMRKYGGWISLVAKVIQEKKVSYEFRF